MNAAAPVQRWYMAYFGVQNFAKNLKESSEKKKTVVFRKRISAKTTVFSVFKSVSRSGKSDDTLTLSAAGARSYSHIVKVSSYARIILSVNINHFHPR